jgi:hypothetical protein
VGLESSEAAALMAAGAELGPRVLVLVALLLVEGLKLSEALALDVARLDCTGWTVHATVVRRGLVQSIALDRRTVQ